MPHHPEGRDWRATLAEDREAVLLADRLGFCEALIGEHVTDPQETITSSLAFVASLADATSSIRLGTGTVNLPNAHPAGVAATAAMIDHLTDGRFVFGVGPGALATDAELFGTLDKNRVEMFLEALEHILALWTEDPPYRRAGKHWKVTTEQTFDAASGSGGILKPLQKPHPEVLCTVLSPFSAGLEALAARGWSAVSSNFLDARVLGAHWQSFSAGREKAGLPVHGKAWRVARSIFVADDRSVARRYGTGLDGPYGQCVRYIHGKLGAGGKLGVFKVDRDQDDADVSPELLMDRLIIAGEPNEVVDSILALRQSAGPFGTLTYVGVDWADPALSRRSMELFAERVMPAVNSALDTGGAEQ